MRIVIYYTKWSNTFIVIWFWTFCAGKTISDWQSLVHQDTLAQLARGDSGIIDVLYLQLEKAAIAAALIHTQGHKSEAADRLGLGRNTLARKAQQFGL